MWDPGAVSCIIRFVCHIPTGMMGAQGIAIYNKVKGLGDIYDIIPHGRTFLQGLQIVGFAVRSGPCGLLRFDKRNGLKANCIWIQGDNDIRLELHPIWSITVLSSRSPWCHGRCRPRSSNCTDHWCHKTGAVPSRVLQLLPQCRGHGERAQLAEFIFGC